MENGTREQKPLNHWFKGFFMGKTCERQGKLLGNDRKLDENGENGLPFLSSFRYNKKGYISKQQGGLRLDSGEKRDIPVGIDGEIKQHFPGLPERGQVSANDFGKVCAVALLPAA